MTLKKNDGQAGSGGAQPPKVSVVIPCYNSGRYLDEAVESVLNQSLKDVEIIIVDDGSTDPGTRDLLDHYHRPKTRIIRTPNQGVSAARNAGIAEARGTYILPLDADDKIEKSYLVKAAGVLDRHPDKGIVYCRVAFFGDREGEWALPPYSLETMLSDNVIFVTALFRKSSWEKAGGFSPNMTHGMEDYDFWISLLEKENCDVHRIEEVLFYYRITEKSRRVLLESNEENEIDMRTRIFYNHVDFFLRDNRIRVWFANRRRLLKEIERLRAVIRDSPTLRVEAGLAMHPTIKRAYIASYQCMFKLLLFVKKTLRRQGK